MKDKRWEYWGSNRKTLGGLGALRALEALRALRALGDSRKQNFVNYENSVMQLKDIEKSKATWKTTWRNFTKPIWNHMEKLTRTSIARVT